MHHRSLRIFRFSLIVLGSIICGCGTKKGPVANTKTETRSAPGALPISKSQGGSLKGSISHNGNPIVAGRIVIFGTKGVVPKLGRIENGHYAAHGIPPGEVTLALILDPAGELPIPPSMMLKARPPAGPKGPSSAPPDPSEKTSPGKNLPLPEMTLDRAEGELPPQLPVQFVRDLQNFAVPPDVLPLYRQLHQKYSTPKGEDVLKCTVRRGETSFDIELK